MDAAWRCWVAMSADLGFGVGIDLRQRAEVEQGRRRNGNRYRSSERWAAQTDWLDGHPVGLTQTVIPVSDSGSGWDQVPQASTPLDDTAATVAVSPPALVDLGPLPQVDAHPETEVG